jgi:hypothetical protein
VREQVHSPATRQLVTCATSATDDVKKKAQDVLNTNNGDVSMTATRRRPGSCAEPPLHCPQMVAETCFMFSCIQFLPTVVHLPFDRVSCTWYVQWISSSA